MAFKWLKKRNRATDTSGSSTQFIESNSVMDLGKDPMDPHGDGTLRPGDPVFELLMNSGAVVTSFNPRPDGQWDVSQTTR
jgi:hypothetical protein